MRQIFEVDADKAKLKLGCSEQLVRLACQDENLYSQQSWVGRPKQSVGTVSQVSSKTLFASTLVVAAKPNLTNQLMRISDASSLLQDFVGLFRLIPTFLKREKWGEKYLFLYEKR